MILVSQSLRLNFMCGIAGILDYRGALSEQRVSHMATLMAHRGPDNQGVRTYGPCVLGHRRLSIIDLSEEANQPFVRGENALVFNGEIYNFLEIKENLASDGVEFRTNSDTEVILAGYEKWGGKELCKRLRGMFAFAIWDAQKSELFLARDRFGEKPLYYSYEESQFVFSSVATTITRTAEKKYRLSETGLVSFFQLGYAKSPYHIFEDICMLPPGHYGVVNKKGIVHRSYWNLHPIDTPKLFNDSLERVERLLQQSVKRQLIADVPLGCLLSGGVDSTLIASLAAEEKPNMHMFTVRMPNSPLDESDLASETAQHLGVNHVIIDAQPVEQNDLYDLMGKFSEPLGDASALGMWMVAREAKKVVTVVLTGDGGDEFFEGYKTVPLHASLESKRGLTANRVGKFLARSAMIATRPFTDVSVVRKGRTYAQLLSKTHKEYHIGKSLIPSEFKSLLKLEKPGAFWEIEAHLGRIWDSSPLPGSRYAQAYFDIKTDLHGDYIPKVDTTTMAHSLEARAPFLDHDLANFGFNLRTEHKYYKNQPKGILKELLRKRVGEQLYTKITSEKRGFILPIDEWFNGRWGDLANNMANSPLVQDGFIDGKIMTKILNKAKLRPERYSRIRFSLLALDIWYRQNVH